jgi:Tol biopolymer transport system component
MTTERVSVDSAGSQGNGDSSYGTLSADGSRVAFESTASNLVRGDTNPLVDIFVHDLASGTTTRVSVASSGAQGDGSCRYCSLSGDGRHVTFESTSRNLVDADTNGFVDVFLHDLVDGTTTRISVGAGGAQANNMSLNLPSSISHDGRFVAFKSVATNLVPGDANGAQDIFLRDRLLGTTTRVNVDSFGAEAQGWSSQPTISPDGQHVGFYSFAENLVPGDTNGEPDVFVRSFDRIRAR